MDSLKALAKWLSLCEAEYRRPHVPNVNDGATIFSRTTGLLELQRKLQEWLHKIWLVDLIWYIGFDDVDPTRSRLQPYPTIFKPIIAA
jgi:hypothetical protein